MSLFLGLSHSKVFTNAGSLLLLDTWSNIVSLVSSKHQLAGKNSTRSIFLLPKVCYSYCPQQSVAQTPTGLLAVTAGCCSAFFWTLFPGAARDRSELRKGLGTSLYLLASYYSSIKATIDLKLQETDSGQRFSSLNRRLTQIRRHLYIKQITIAERLNEHNSFAKWEPNLGGKFPAKTYNDVAHVIEKYSYPA